MLTNKCRTKRPLFPLMSKGIDSRFFSALNKIVSHRCSFLFNPVCLCEAAGCPASMSRLSHTHDASVLLILTLYQR